MEQDQPSISIRLARASEAEAIASAILQSFVEYRASYTPDGFAVTTPAADTIRGRLHEGPVWVARRQDVIVGTVSAAPKGAACYVRSMAIVPAARGLGLGRLLLERVEAFAASQGHTYLLLSTTPFLARAIRLYEQVGFRRTADGPHDLYGTALFTMVKPLAGDDHRPPTTDQRPPTTDQ
ncbi:MAG TPA: GNAT family N-acetyltransferase [Roseiflexaceae bacterium]|nr:GNAT family N-acetyltransferase [Roseiflexaceae bacterium]